MKSKQNIFTVCSVVALLALSLADANAASIRLRCVQTATSSKISVDARDVTPGKSYQAWVKSGKHAKFSGFQKADINGEDEFDFSSRPKDQTAGATAISADFIVGTPPSVTAKVLDKAGFVVARDTVDCVVK